MVTMICPPGACLWTRDSVLYRDDGSGTVEIANGHHLEEAIAAGWSIIAIEETPEPNARRARRRTSELDQKEV
jgi:hypothetical protein